MLRNLVRVLASAEKQDAANLLAKSTAKAPASAKPLLQKAGSSGKASAAGSGQAVGAAATQASGSKAASSTI